MYVNKERSTRIMNPPEDIMMCDRGYCFCDRLMSFNVSFIEKIVASFTGMHMSPAKHIYV